MALSRVTTWNSGDVLTAAALNGEFNNVLNNALTLISPLTGNLDVNLKQLLNVALEPRASAPTAGTAGRVSFNTVETQLNVDDATNIRRVPTLTGVAQGDIIYASATNQWARLGAGGNGLVLTLAAGIPTWGSVATSPLFNQVFGG